MPRPTGNLYWALLAFVLAFAILLLAVVGYYLLPALSAWQSATETERQRIAAYSSLLLTVLLLILLVGLWGVFRLMRTPPRKPPPTPYVDAWAEAGRRLQLPDEDPPSR